MAGTNRHSKVEMGEMNFGRRRPMLTYYTEHDDTWDMRRTRYRSRRENDAESPLAISL